MKLACSESHWYSLVPRLGISMSTLDRTEVRDRDNSDQDLIRTELPAWVDVDIPVTALAG